MRRYAPFGYFFLCTSKNTQTSMPYLVTVRHPYYNKDTLLANMGESHSSDAVLWFAAEMVRNHKSTAYIRSLPLTEALKLERVCEQEKLEHCDRKKHYFLRKHLPLITMPREFLNEEVMQKLVSLFRITQKTREMSIR